ncbi:class I adenylate-forming enzyme family protein [Mycobacterium stomatepiae]|uniref:AMP-binding protein n=1 Tax=Mycobacterium stomatepiae TaxID=470076 RepID=A0A7I7Q7Q9_9MYCO|nr:class I adenylate-forming enzyme family protein [Mycobacterium stomatepiae]MCV7163018.1 acyl--CoA ligase [Mycobacterium stomatepiae]BBY22161.1 AMP-binding protein [Mycobacterium stomatepiae]
MNPVSTGDAPLGTSETVPKLLAELARRRPTKTAVVTPQESAGYADMLARSSTLAAKLVTMGARKGTVVALLLPNGGDWIWWWAACARIGAVVVPMNTFATSVEVQRVLSHSGAHMFVAVPAFADKTYRDDLADLLGSAGPSSERRAAELPQLRRVLWLDEVETVAPDIGTDAVVAALADDVEACDVLTIIYSSGSTGDPKGVVHSHGSALRQARRLGRLTATDEPTVLWTSMPLKWVGGLVWSFLRTAVAGGTFVTQPWFEPGAALALLSETSVDTVTAWGPVVERMRQHPSYSDEMFGHIKGLGWLLPQDGERPSALGMTETLGPHSGWPVSAAWDVPAGAAGSWGRALSDMAHRIVDPITLSDVSDGQTGELLVRGDALMLGLHRRERQAVFTPDGWYRTGDAAALRDGWLFFNGRLDDVIKTAGANVSPAEVQAVLEAQPTVRQAFVVGVPAAARGEDVGAVLVGDDDTLDVPTILAAARQQLASYKVPKLAVVMHEDDIPWLSSQKVDIRRLRAMLVDQRNGRQPC